LLTGHPAYNSGAWRIDPIRLGETGIMTDEIKNPSNRVDQSANGGFIAFWRGQVVYQNGRVKKFETEGNAREYLTRCDAAGKIIH
jgi:hypothetical protein